MSADTKSSKPILYFDGVCGFCNGMVNLVMSLDREHRIRFAPLQGETARRLLGEDQSQDLSSIVFTRNGKNYRLSAASIRILWELGGLWSVLGTMMWLVPKPLRDFGYFLFSKVRYRIAGRSESCRMPQPGEEELILP